MTTAAQGSTTEHPAGIVAECRFVVLDFGKEVLVKKTKRYSRTSDSDEAAEASIHRDGNVVGN
jgi:hypothetical protein